MVQLTYRYASPEYPGYAAGYSTAEQYKDGISQVGALQVGQSPTAGQL
jgi:hypothetical protein